MCNATASSNPFVLTRVSLFIFLFTSNNQRGGQRLKCSTDNWLPFKNSIACLFAKLWQLLGLCLLTEFHLLTQILRENNFDTPKCHETEWKAHILSSKSLPEILYATNILDCNRWCLTFKRPCNSTRKMELYSPILYHFLLILMADLNPWHRPDYEYMN